MRPTRIPIASLTIAVLAALAFAAPSFAATEVYTNETPITIPDKGNASPYPSQVNVQGVPGRIADLNVTLHGFSHSFPLDADVLLVSPGGEAAVVMSDVNCGARDPSNATWIFDQSAASPLGPPCDQLVYRPTDIDNTQSDPGPDSWPGAPPGDHAADFDRFIGDDPNGTWRLYVLDDGSPDRDSGRIARGWSLTLQTQVADALVPGPGQGGRATPYPTTVRVSGQTGVIEDLDVSLPQNYHARADDLDLYLVSPGGQKVALMSDACGPAARNAGWRWDDEAPAPMPDNGPCPDGSYRPTDHEPGDGPPAPAPPGPYGTSLSAFDGTDPNGEWLLYAYDDRVLDADGLFLQRFELHLTMRTPDTTPPETRIDAGPTGRTERRTARFRFSASESGSSFQCKLDGGGFKRCASPKTFRRLRVGRHRFAVRAIDAAGNVDPTPAKRRWRVVR